LSITTKLEFLRSAGARVSKNSPSSADRFGTAITLSKVRLLLSVERNTHTDMLEVFDMAAFVKDTLEGPDSET